MRARRSPIAAISRVMYRNASLDRAETASLLALLLADLMQFRPNGAEVLENQIGRVLAHRDYCVFATVALQYCSSNEP